MATTSRQTLTMRRQKGPVLRLRARRLQSLYTVTLYHDCLPSFCRMVRRRSPSSRVGCSEGFPSTTGVVVGLAEGGGGAVHRVFLAFVWTPIVRHRVGQVGPRAEHQTISRGPWSRDLRDPPAVVPRGAVGREQWQHGGRRPAVGADALTSRASLASLGRTSTGTLCTRPPHPQPPETAQGEVRHPAARPKN